MRDYIHIIYYRKVIKNLIFKNIINLKFKKNTHHKTYLIKSIYFN